MRRKSGFLILCLVSVFLFVCAVDLAHAAPPEGKGPKVKPVLLARTGQTTSYAPGDDGDLQMGVPSPTPRFIDNGDGTATDRLIGLTWTKDGSLYFIHWSDALSACNAYSVGTLDDWRMPNIRELQSLLDYEQSNPMLPVGHPFINIQMGGFYYWSSTTNAAWDTYHDVFAVAMDSGWARIWPKDSGGYVLCVRGDSSDDRPGKK